MLAYAGLLRLDMADVATCLIETDEMLPAVAQGEAHLDEGDGDDGVAASEANRSSIGRRHSTSRSAYLRR